MPIFQFYTLWKNHPTVKGDDPLLDRKVYANQCAVNVSAALMRSGVSLKDFRGAMSWQKDKEKYAIRAQELADWLKLRPRMPCSFEKIAGTDFAKRINRRSGIIFFQNYWGTGRQGDHIDLWNGSRLTSTESWTRIHLNLHWRGVWDDYRKAEGIWFWAIS